MFANYPNTKLETRENVHIALPHRVSLRAITRRPPFPLNIIYGNSGAERRRIPDRTLYKDRHNENVYGLARPEFLWTVVNLKNVRERAELWGREEECREKVCRQEMSVYGTRRKNAIVETYLPVLR